MNLNLSERHHYIPKFLIKGFVGKDGKLSVFNKRINKLESIRKSPKQIFFEWNRNTFSFKDDEKTDFLEKAYQLGESKFSKTYKYLTEKNEPIKIEPYDLLHLTLFISVTYWRVPNQDLDIYEYLKSLTTSNFRLKIKDKNKLQDIPDELFNQMIKEPAFIESSKILKAFEDYLDNQKNINLNNWKIYYRPDDAPQLNLLSDNPVILRTEEKNILNSELIFPLSKGKTVFHTNGKSLKEISGTIKLSVDILTFINAKQYVCSSDENYLKSISEISKMYNTIEKVNYLKNEIFEIFE